MMERRKASVALDYAALLFAHTLGIEACAREPFDPAAGEEDEESDVRFACSISEGPMQELGYAMGADEPYEFEMAALGELIGAEGVSEEERRAFIEDKLLRLAEAVENDPTLGGCVDFAEIGEPNPDMADHYSAMVFTMRITYTARTALG